MALNRTVEPASEPITLAEAKAQCRITFTNDDALITTYIASARDAAENLLNRSLLPQTWELTLDEFPEAIRLDYPPITAVSSVQYLEATAGVLTTLSPSSYTVDSKSAPGWIVPAYGYTWPDTLQAINAVTVTYTAGYANAEAVPAVIKHWMLAHIAMSDANAELTAQGAGIKIITNPYLDRLLDRYCVNVAA